MAGIGFSLQSLNSQDNIISRIASIGHAAVVAAGPWLFTILSLGLITLTSEQVAGYGTLATFRAVVIYAFGLSLVTSAPVVMVTTRLVADAIYQRRYEGISGLFLGALFLTLVPATPIVCALYFLAIGVPLDLGVAAVSCCLIVALMWVAIAMCGAVRDYGGVTLAFLAGLVLSLVLTLVATVSNLGAIGLIWSFNAGLVMTLFWLISRVLVTFPQPLSNPFSAIGDVLAALWRYRIIALGAVAATIAIWIDKWIMWMSEIGEKVEGGLIHAPLYDSAMFVACLSFIPALSFFVIHLETGFFESYQRYFTRIRNHATLKQIEAGRKELVEVTLSSQFHIILVQAGLSAIVVMMAPVIVDLLHLQYRQISILRFGAIAALFQFIFLACSAVLLFFDRRWSYLLLQVLFLVLNAGGTWISLKLGWRFHGLGFLAATLIASLASYFVMERTLIRLNYLTFIGNNPSVRE